PRGDKRGNRGAGSVATAAGGSRHGGDVMPVRLELPIRMPEGAQAALVEDEIPGNGGGASGRRPVFDRLRGPSVECACALGHRIGGEAHSEKRAGSGQDAEGKAMIHGATSVKLSYESLRRTVRYFAMPYVTKIV